MTTNKINTEYTYKAFVHNVVDGDTFDAFVIVADFGFKIYHMTDQRFRLLGIDTFEVRGGTEAQKELGHKATDRVVELMLGKKIVLRSEKQGKYGRYLAAVTLDNGESLTAILIGEGFEKREL